MKPFVFPGRSGKRACAQVRGQGVQPPEPRSAFPRTAFPVTGNSYTLPARLLPPEPLRETGSGGLSPTAGAPFSDPSSERAASRHPGRSQVETPKYGRMTIWRRNHTATTASTIATSRIALISSAAESTDCRHTNATARISNQRQQAIHMGLTSVGYTYRARGFEKRPIAKRPAYGGRQEAERETQGGAVEAGCGGRSQHS